jgi:hypothetical protein
VVTARITLSDAEAMHAANPETFGLSPRSVRESIAIGETVLLCFTVGHRCSECYSTHTHSAHLWVKVTASEGGRYRGRLVYGGRRLALKERESVEFGPEHIYLTKAESLALARRLQRRETEAEVAT